MGRHGDGYDDTILAFMAIAAETMGAINSDGMEFL